MDVGWLRFIAAAVKQSRAMPVVGKGGIGRRGGGKEEQGGRGKEEDGEKAKRWGKGSGGGRGSEVKKWEMREGDEKEEVGPPSGYLPPALRRDQS